MIWFFQLSRNFSLSMFPLVQHHAITYWVGVSTEEVYLICFDWNSNFWFLTSESLRSSWLGFLWRVIQNLPSLSSSKNPAVNISECDHFSWQITFAELSCEHISWKRECATVLGFVLRRSDVHTFAIGHLKRIKTLLYQEREHCQDQDTFNALASLLNTYLGSFQLFRVLYFVVS